MCKNKNKFGFEWIQIKNEQLPPVDEEVVFSCGIREFVGTMDSSFEIWECKNVVHTENSDDRCDDSINISIRKAGHKQHRQNEQQRDVRV